MTKILFICHGNICRSPMAEFVMKDLAAKAGRSDDFEIASAAVSREEIGNGVHHGTRRKLAQVGISCAGKTARQVTAGDYPYYDLLIVMDRDNLRRLEGICGEDREGKMHLLLDFTPRAGQEVADPWYTGNFEDTYRDVLEGCEALLAQY